MHVFYKNSVWKSIVIYLYNNYNKLITIIIYHFVVKHNMTTNIFNINIFLFVKKINIVSHQKLKNSEIKFY